MSINSKCENFKLDDIDGNIVIFISNEEQKNWSSDNSQEIQIISNNTENTWQPNRPKAELLKNTKQGKIAEAMFLSLVEFYKESNSDGNKLIYTSYDDIRQDELKKHAPFDGILYIEGNTNVKYAIDLINEDVKNNDYGKITNNTKKELRSRGIKTVEIKSSKVPAKDYEGVNKEDLNNVIEQKKLITNLRKRDFFVYPRFKRTIGETVHCFKDYCKYLNKQYYQFRGLNEEQLISKVCEMEKEDKCDIYTRIFIEDSNTDLLTGYILGYALGTDFFENPQIINMPQKGKSEKAIYYAYPIQSCNQILDIFSDNRLW